MAELLPTALWRVRGGDRLLGDPAGGRLHCGAAQVLERFMVSFGFVMLFGGFLLFVSLLVDAGFLLFVSLLVDVGFLVCLVGIDGRSECPGAALHQGHGVLVTGETWGLLFYVDSLD